MPYLEGLKLDVYPFRRFGQSGLDRPSEPETSDKKPDVGVAVCVPFPFLAPVKDVRWPDGRF